MAGIREKARALFGNEVSCRDVPGSFVCSFEKEGELPSLPEIKELFSEVSARDSMEINFRDQFSGAVLRAEEDSVDYMKFAAGVSKDDRTKIDIEIRKSVRDGVLSVYCLEKFLEFFTEEGTDTLTRLERWNVIVKFSGGRTAFEVLDEDVEFHAGAFIFTNDAVGFEPEKEMREEKTRIANEACTFMDRREIKLLPGDFDVKTKAPQGGTWRFGRLAESMRKLDTVMAVIYLGASSRLEGKKEAVLEITRGGREFHFPLDDIPENETLTKLVAWILSEENAVERADVARNAVSLLCRDEQQILTADASLMDSVRSNFNLYKRKNVDQYIEAKKLLSQSILDVAKQIEDLMGTLVDGFKTNFIAIITVVITQVLKDNINLDKIGKGDFVDVTFKAVVTIYIAASVIYLVITLVHIFFKWDFYRKYFRQTKEKLSGLLDEKELASELEKADKIKRGADMRLLLYCVIMTVLWAALLVIVWSVGSRL